MTERRMRFLSRRPDQINNALIQKDFQVLKSFANAFKVSQDRISRQDPNPKGLKSKNPLRGSNDPRTDVPPMSQPPIGSDREGAIAFKDSMIHLVLFVN
jgi:hypothetical protein